MFFQKLSANLIVTAIQCLTIGLSFCRKIKILVFHCYVIIFNRQRQETDQFNKILENVKNQFALVFVTPNDFLRSLEDYGFY